jgi:hypothetical protein
MKQLLFASLICLIILACTKEKKSKQTIPANVSTSYTANLSVGDKVYNASNYTVRIPTTSNYQWDGLNIYSDYPALGATEVNGGYEIFAFDTAAGAITQQPLLLFGVPGVKVFSNYSTILVNIYLFDTAYSGTALVSAAITGNGNKTYNGTFSLNGMVASDYSADSIPFSASGTFTNAIYN